MISTLRYHCKAKIAQQDMITRTQQQVFRFDIAMNQVSIVGILQSISCLLNVGKDIC